MRQTRSVASLALIAMLWAALAPALSALMQGSSQRIELPQILCGGGQLQALSVSSTIPDDEPPAKQAPRERMSACLLCSMHTGPALPSAEVYIPLPEPARVGPPQRFYQAPETAAVWMPSRARAPPLRLA